MWLPTRSMVDAASRHAISIAGTAFVIFGLQSKGITLDQVKETITALGETVNDIVLLIGTAGTLYGGLKAMRSASPTNQIASVAAIAQDPASPAQSAAAATLITSIGQIAASAAAQPVTDNAGSENVLQFARDAKVALLDATAAQPEVVGRINVTDEDLVKATESNQVQKAA